MCHGISYLSRDRAGVFGGRGFPRNPGVFRDVELTSGGIPFEELPKIEQKFWMKNNSGRVPCVKLIL